MLNGPIKVIKNPVLSVGSLGHLSGNWVRGSNPIVGNNWGKVQLLGAEPTGSTSQQGSTAHQAQGTSSCPETVTCPCLWVGVMAGSCPWCKSSMSGIFILSVVPSFSCLKMRLPLHRLGRVCLGVGVGKSEETNCWGGWSGNFHAQMYGGVPPHMPVEEETGMHVVN